MCSHRGLEARRPQGTAGHTPIPARGPHPDNWSEAHGSLGFPAAAPGQGPLAYTPTPPPKARGRRDRLAAGTGNHPLLQVFPGGGSLGVVLQIGLLLGLDLQDAFHVVLMCELRGTSAQRDHALCPDRQALGSLPTPQPPGQTDRLSGPSPRPSPQDGQTGSQVPPQAPAQLPEASTSSAPPQATSTSLSRVVA